MGTRNPQEVVTEHPTEHFLLALGRITGRREKIQYLYCDNGTSFFGADSPMKAFHLPLQADYGKWIAPKHAMK